MSAAEQSFRIALPAFEGPLDLLLHLIREHKLDILDIPIALVTQKYLEYLDRMKELNLDIAGEFLVMAATLTQIKSRLLLPQKESPVEGEPTEEAQDPRAALVRRLLEYQKYKEAAATLGRQPLLGREVFVRKVSTKVLADDPEIAEVSIFKLIEALDQVLKSLDPAIQHEVVRERLSLSDAILRIAELLREKGEVPFLSLFEVEKGRQSVVIGFLAVLEMCKLRLIRIRQDPTTEEITVCARGDALVPPYDGA